MADEYRASPSQWKGTRALYLKGKGKWIRPFVLNDWKKWSMRLYPDDAAIAIISELQERGLKNKFGTDDDGKYIVISCPFDITVKGRKIGLVPPAVIDKEGNEVPAGTEIGDGSDVTVKVDVYNFTFGGVRGTAMRWVGLRIDNLVPVIKMLSFDEVQERNVNGLAEQPEHTF